MTEVSRSFPQSLQAYSGIEPKGSPGSLYFTFVPKHDSINHAAIGLYIIFAAGSVVKQTKSMLYLRFSQLCLCLLLAGCLHRLLSTPKKEAVR
jgi:hypothetical protein